MILENLLKSSKVNKVIRWWEVVVFCGLDKAHKITDMKSFKKERRNDKHVFKEQSCFF